MKWDNPNDFETVLNLLTNDKEGTIVWVLLVVGWKIPLMKQLRVLLKKLHL
jgi:hypothetical protein